MGLRCSRRAPRVPTEPELLQLQKIEFLLRRPFNADTDSDVDKLRNLWSFFNLIDDDNQERLKKRQERQRVREEGQDKDGTGTAVMSTVGGHLSNKDGRHDYRGGEIDSSRGSFKLVSTAWKNIGFQQENPLKDIRSGGTLAICNLDFFLRKYPAKMRAMCLRQQEVRLQSRYRRGYPFATAGINVTRMICMLLHVVNKYGARLAYDTIQLPYWQIITTPDTNPFRASRPRTISDAESGNRRTARRLRSDAEDHSDDSNDSQDRATATVAATVVEEEQVHLGQHINESLNPVHELYCVAFVVMDREFRRADALNMEFNLVLERTYEIIREAIVYVLGNSYPLVDSSEEYQIDTVQDLRECLGVDMYSVEEDLQVGSKRRRNRNRNHNRNGNGNSSSKNNCDGNGTHSNQRDRRESGDKDGKSATITTTQGSSSSPSLARMMNHSLSSPSSPCIGQRDRHYRQQRASSAQSTPHKKHEYKYVTYNDRGGSRQSRSRVRSSACASDSRSSYVSKDAEYGFGDSVGNDCSDGTGRREGGKGGPGADSDGGGDSGGGGGGDDRVWAGNGSANTGGRNGSVHGRNRHTSGPSLPPPPTVASQVESLTMTQSTILLGH